jgi:RNA polymerase sigma-70 factor, ECF subfamily
VLVAYARRRCTPEDAADLVADTFLVAWRRIAEVPPRDEARLWLFGVARNLLANQRRGQERRSRLADRLRADLRTAEMIEPEPGNGQLEVRALAQLDEQDRELLLLVGGEELTSAQIARVLGISVVAARSRLHRARRRFKQALSADSAPEAEKRPVELEARS